MQFRRVIDYFEGICILHNDPGIAQNLEITEQKSELTITNLSVHPLYKNIDKNFEIYIVGGVKRSPYLQLIMTMIVLCIRRILMILLVKIGEHRLTGSGDTNRIYWNHQSHMETQTCQTTHETHFTNN